MDAQEVEERRSLILESTLNEIARSGVASVRMKDIARSAGVSVGTIQYYFDSKDGLVLEALERHSEAVITQVRDAATLEGEPETALTTTIHNFTHVADFDHRTKLWMEFIAASTRDSVLRGLLDQVFLAWREVVSEIVSSGVRAGRFSPIVDPEVAVDAILAQLDGFEVAHATGARNTDSDRIERVLLESTRAMLGIE